MLPLLSLALPIASKVMESLGAITRNLANSPTNNTTPYNKNITHNQTHINIHNKISY